MRTFLTETNICAYTDTRNQSMGNPASRPAGSPLLTSCAPAAFDLPADTRVLQGHIDLASAVFPAGTTGQQLDLLARLGVGDEVFLTPPFSHQQFTV